MSITTRKPVPRSTFLLLLKDRYSITLLCENCKTNKFEQIHHIDGNPNNNDPSNLMLLCHMCHGKEHGPKNFIIKDTGPSRFSIILHSSEIEFKRLLGYNNMLVANGRRKLRLLEKYPLSLIVTSRILGPTNFQYFQVS